MSGGQENVVPDGKFGVAYALHSVSTSRVDVCGELDEEMGAHLHEGLLRRTRSLPDCSDPTDEADKIKIGICAMDKKARSNPMTEIIKRLERNGDIHVEVFGDETILNKDVDEWPECDCLLSWHSEGFPIDKAIRYCEKQRPLLVNDLAKQHILFDRRRVYNVLQKAKIPVPNHIIIDRDSLKEGEDVEGLIEEEDFFEYKGKRMYKPFVEKPANGDDHNIYIYYPQPMGGGVKKLFRKIDNKSAEYNPDHPGTIRRAGSYVYEEFLTTGGTDVKVYTVGPAYAHAEARKSPVVDGKVLRTRQGKEVRFPVLLSPAEKEIARLVTIAFGQKVCGFDLLRSDKGSFVCDVNGWSFVKSSYKYYDDAAGILRTLIMASLAPKRLHLRPIKPHAESPDFKGDGTKSQISETLSYDDLSPLDGRHPRMINDSEPQEELRCVLAVLRHGDRTPKQKLKIKVTQSAMLELFERHKDAKGKQAKLKAPYQLQELLDVARKLLKEIRQEAEQDSETKKEDLQGTKSAASDSASDKFELCEKFSIVVSVLEAGGHFSGINRKVQLKPLRWSQNTDPPMVEEVLLILKHGGVLTHAGRRQAEAMGSHFRQVMYPSAGSGTPGGGLLRLHSTYRHDLKIYSSDEGRVQTSAAAFIKGLLALEGSSLTPILASLVKKDALMLDSFDKGASEDIQRSKAKLYEQVTWNEDKHVAALTPPTGATPAPSPSPCGSPIAATDKESSDSDGGLFPPPIPQMPENPLQLLHKLVEQMQVLKDELLNRCRREAGTERKLKPYSTLSQDPREWEADAGRPCSGEKLLLTYDRWRKLLKSFYNLKKDQFDISKVPDIYDSVKYDAIHNWQMKLPLKDLYKTAKVLATVVVPNEYGITPKDKLRIGSRICSQLLGKLLADLGNTKEESRMTSHTREMEIFGNEGFPGSCEENDTWSKGMVNDLYAPNIGSKDVSGGGSNSADDEGEPETFHRLSPSYALNINSPLRHVRTRIYFTSESHIHGLMNVLRYGHLGCTNDEGVPMQPMLSDERQEMFQEIPEFDYLTHIVFRMFEKVQVPADDPNRFRIEVSFSPGSSFNPISMQPWLKEHTLPIYPRAFLREEITLEKLAELFSPYAEPRKIPQSLSWLTSISK